MPSKTRPYREVLLRSLTNPDVAAAYLSEAMDDSQEMFRKALRNVAQSRQMSKVAKDAGVTRESLYRATSEIGNPTLDTLDSVLGVLDLKLAVVTKSAEVSTGPRTLDSQTHGVNSDRENKSETASAATINLMSLGSNAAALSVDHHPCVLELKPIMFHIDGKQEQGVPLQGLIGNTQPNAGSSEGMCLLPGFLMQQQAIQTERANVRQ